MEAVLNFLVANWFLIASFFLLSYAFNKLHKQIATRYDAGSISGARKSAWLLFGLSLLCTFWALGDIARAVISGELWRHMHYLINLALTGYWIYITWKVWQKYQAFLRLPLFSRSGPRRKQPPGPDFTSSDRTGKPKKSDKPN